jgi:hypothetical protein
MLCIIQYSTRDKLRTYIYSKNDLGPLRKYSDEISHDSVVIINREGNITTKIYNQLV